MSLFSRRIITGIVAAVGVVFPVPSALDDGFAVFLATGAPGCFQWNEARVCRGVETGGRVGPAELAGLSGDGRCRAGAPYLASGKSGTRGFSQLL